MAVGSYGRGVSYERETTVGGGPAHPEAAEWRQTRFRAKRWQLEKFGGLLLESQCQNLALTGLYGPRVDLVSTVDVGAEQSAWQGP